MLASDLYEVALLIGACFLVNYVTADSRTNWAGEKVQYTLGFDPICPNVNFRGIYLVGVLRYNCMLWFFSFRKTIHS